jgi:hypothetical protein
MGRWRKNQELRLVKMTSSGSLCGMEIKRGPGEVVAVAAAEAAAEAAEAAAEEARECHGAARGATLHINLEGEHIPAEEDRPEDLGVAAVEELATAAAGGAPSGVDNREVDVHYCCPICFEAPSGLDILRYFTIFPVSCVRFLIHFCFRENVRYFHNFS